MTGGVLSDSSASWRTIFWLQAGLSSLLVVTGWLVLPRDETSMRYNKGLDWVGAVLSTAGLGLLVYDLACVHYLNLSSPNFSPCLQRVYRHTERMGDTICPFTIQHVHRTPHRLRAMGTPPRSTQRICPVSDEYVDASGREDGTGHLNRLLRLVGIQWAHLLRVAVLSRGATTQPSTDRAQTCPNGNLGE